ncbi:awd [Cordylochernes scorpioides]|uniref:Nucleoside diphosphate kinase n=1 Tax=Cordylochernes scorpioides TaxID=51811 RepID=A0ABY6KV63_9ARAC|nr:awd [Cordylochernes scorpioides]
MARERTFIMIKPDGVQRGLIGQIIERFERKGFKLVAMKLVQASDELLRQHYSDLAGRPFFEGLVKYMQMGPVVPMVWEGLNVVATGRDMIGATNPIESKPGTIRGDLCIQVGRHAPFIPLLILPCYYRMLYQRSVCSRNIIHGSDSLPSAEKEIALWFGEKELANWTPAQSAWVYED